MTSPANDFDLLSAYIDGELDPADAAHLARRIASDETLARQAAKLAEMKSALAAPVHDVIFVNIMPRQSSRGRIWAAGLAACLALALVSVLWQIGPTAKADDDIAQAIAQHDVWVGGSPEMTVSPVSVPAGFFAPELNAAGLAIAYVRTNASIAGKQAVQVGYVGRNGCRLSLFRLIADARTAAQYSLTSDATLQRAVWRDAANVYLLVARGMDQSRFATIAGVLRDLTSDAPKPAPEATAALQSPHLPCIG